MEDKKFKKAFDEEYTKLLISEKIVGTGLAPVRVQLSYSGQIIDKQWNKIPNQYRNVKCDQYVIMPNHIHGILIINKRTGVRRGGSLQRYQQLSVLLNQERLENIYKNLRVLDAINLFKQLHIIDLANHLCQN